MKLKETVPDTCSKKEHSGIKLEELTLLELFKLREWLEYISSTTRIPNDKYKIARQKLAELESVLFEKFLC
jgi:hypothetical protein